MDAAVTGDELTQELAMLATETKLNGIDTEALRSMMARVSRDPAEGKVGFRVATRWTGGTRSETSVDTWELGGRRLWKKQLITADEPVELLGQNTAPNPQELLMAALNACMTVGYVTSCAVRGIKLESLQIETHGELDLRGFLGLDDSVPPGYRSVHYTVRIKGNGTPEQFQEIHDIVRATSPNYFNLSQPIKLLPELIVE